MATEAFPSSTPAGVRMAQDRAARYYTSLRGQRYACCHQTPGTGVTGQTSFAATTPTFLLYQAGVASRLVLAGMTLTQIGAVAGGNIGIALAIDSANRYASGGTAITPAPMLAGGSRAALATFRTGATASAAGSGTKYIFETLVAASVGEVTSLDFKDGIIIPATGSVLIYTWAAVTGPTWAFSIEFTEDLI